MIGGAVLLAMLAGCAQAQEPASPYDFDRPLIYSVNPVGSGSFVGSRSRGSDFVNHETLIFQKCQEIGSRSARVLASWREIEEVKGQWDWSSLDREMAHCERFGIVPVVLIVNIPAWVSPTGEPAHDYPPKEENVEDFNHFITTLAERYKGRAKHYEFWNEQNGFGWHVDKVDGRFRYNRADEYIPWLYRCYKAIKAVDPEALVAMGGLDNAEGYSPTFVRMSYEMRRDMYGGEKFWDAIGDHPYNKKPEETDDRPIEKLEAIRAVAAEFGDGDIPIWITEYGWNAQDRGIDVAHHAKWTRRFLQRFARPEHDYIHIAQQLAMSDFEPVHQGFGVCNLNLKPGPAFYAFQEEARPLEPGLHDLVYRVDVDGSVRVYAWLRGDMKRGSKLVVDVVDEAGAVVAKARPVKLSKKEGDTAGNRVEAAVKLERLPRGAPLLARFSYVIEGVTQPPIARLPLAVPATGELIAQGDFDGLYRSGVPWGWRVFGDLIVRNGGVLGPEHVKDGEESLLVVMFDNHKEYRFSERIETPVAARRGEAFHVRGWARLHRDFEKDPQARMHFRLVEPGEAVSEFSENVGTLIGDDWTLVEQTIRSPVDAPLLGVELLSPPLPTDPEKRRNPQRRWLVVIDAISMEGAE